MAIVEEDVARVRAAADIVEIITPKTSLRRSGSRWVGLCPFHGERTPSFSVNAAQGLYHCFGCGKSGDVFTFVQESEHVDFAGAVEFLARKYGIDLHYTNRGEDEGRRRRHRLVAAVGRAVDWYHDRLLSAPDAGEARRYLRSRGFDRDAVVQFRLGWAPSDDKDWALLAKAMRLSDDDWRDSGLGGVNKRGRQFDFFRGRVMFPIFDERGDAVAFGGRVLPGHEGAKYVNTRDGTPLYAKSRVLYGLNWAKETVVREGFAVVCEGYTDVIGLVRSGVPNAVATCGTALTDEHVQLLKRFANRVVLAFDADAAGQNAAARVYEWERRHEIEVSVADLPPGVDPGELAVADPERLRAAVSGARPFLQFRVDRVLDSADLTRPEGRARAAEACLAMIREHPSELVRDQYLMVVADRCRFEADQLRARLHAPAASGGGGGGGTRVRIDRGAGRRVPVATDTAEDEALRLLLQRPDEMAAWPLSPALFASAVRRAAFEAVAETADLHAALASVDDEVAELLRRAAVDETTAEPEQVAADLARYGAARSLDELRREAERAATTDELRDVADTIAWLRHTTAGLDAAETRADAAAELLAWLAGLTDDDATGDEAGDVAADAAAPDAAAPAPGPTTGVGW